MNRRSLLIGGAASVAAVLVSKNATASTAPTMAGGVYYTEQNPGRWAKKAAGHAPVIEAKSDGGSTTLQVVTGHEMKGYEHYIIKHMILDANYQFVAEHFFNPEKDNAPISSFNLGDKKGTFYALSVCNLHDTWMSSITI